MFINNTSISTQQLSSGAYQLQVDFLNEKGSQSNKVFTFIKKGDYTAKEKEIVDLYSLNSTVNFDSFTGLKGVCETRDKTEFIRSLTIEPSQYIDNSTIFTLDMKDKQKGYIHAEIPAGEETVCDYFSGKTNETQSKSLRKTRNALTKKKLSLDFIYCEGSLKQKLLSLFEDRQAEYLNSKEGTTQFCKLAEAFMNAAKLGHHQRETAPEQFIYSVAKSKAFYPYQTSTIRYPKGYKETVCSVVAMFQPVFSSSCFVDLQTDITILKLKEKV